MTSLPTKISCAYCGGNAFTLVILLNGNTSLRCVNHDAHVKELDLAGKQRARNAEIERRAEQEIAEQDAERERRR